MPGRHGVGDLGHEAYRFVDFLAASGQSLWQVLPLGPTGYGNSPYQCFSAFAGNTLLVSPELLVEQGLLAPGALEGLAALADDRVDYGEAFPHKEALLKEAFDNFKRTEPAVVAAAFEEFKSAASGVARRLRALPLAQARAQRSGVDGVGGADSNDATQPLWTRRARDFQNR